MCGRDVHHPDDCAAKRKPNMRGFDTQPAQTRRASEQAVKRGVKLRGHSQTSMTRARYELHEKRYKSAHKLRSRQLLAEAQSRCRAYLHELKAPIEGSGALGQFTFYEKAAYEFIMRLPSHMTESQLERDPSYIDNVALQTFARAVKKAGLPSLDAARAKGESKILNFAALRDKLTHSSTGSISEAMVTLINHAHKEERIKYGRLQTVATLSPNASLLEIIGAVHEAAMPKLGRRKSSTQCSDRVY